MCPATKLHHASHKKPFLSFLFSAILIVGLVRGRRSAPLVHTHTRIHTLSHTHASTHKMPRSLNTPLCLSVSLSLCVSLWLSLSPHTHTHTNAQLSVSLVSAKRDASDLVRASQPTVNREKEGGERHTHGHRQTCAHINTHISDTRNAVCGPGGRLSR